jgi:hypothetical protein
MSHESHDRIRRWVTLKAPAAEVLAAVGAFDSVAAWHPMVTESPAFDLDGEPHRHLKLTDGGLFLERLLDKTDTAYRYAVVEGPAALSEGVGAFSVVAEAGGGCHVYWSLDFQPDDPNADAIVAGLLETGLAALRERFGDGAAKQGGA